MKKQYIRPLVEAQAMESAISIMKTSIDLLPDMAPKRVPSLSNDSVQVF